MRHRRHRRTAALLAAVIVPAGLAACGGRDGGGSSTAAGTTGPAAGVVAPSGAPATARDFDARNFSHPTRIDNPWIRCRLLPSKSPMPTA